jgi:hypothetical protein
LTPFQEKQMAFQPDFIWNMLITSIIIIKNKVINPEVYVESYALNGRLSKKYIDPKINLAKKMKILNTKIGYCLSMIQLKDFSLLFLLLLSAATYSQNKIVGTITDTMVNRCLL